MEQHGFETLDEFKGHAVPYVTTHAELVRLQGEARQRKRAVLRDENWDQDAFVEQSEALAAG